MTAMTTISIDLPKRDPGLYPSFEFSGDMSATNRIQMCPGEQ